MLNLNPKILHYVMLGVLGYQLRKCMKEGHMASIRGSQSSSQPEPGLGS